MIQNEYEKIRETLFSKYSKEELIDQIIELADRGISINQWLYNLTANKKNLLEIFNRTILEFKERKRQYDWNESTELEKDLEDLLYDLEQGVEDPRTGILALKTFFECDEEIVESAHDFLGTSFSETAINLFVKYSEQIDDKEWVYSIATEMLEHDEYQVRETLSENMHRYIPKQFLREKVNDFFSNQENSKLNSLTVQNIAKGLKDPIMLEAAFKLTNSLDINHVNIELGEAWLKAGNPEKAITYLERINSKFISNEKLLLEAYRLNKNSEKEKKLLWNMFKDHRTKENFDNYLLCAGSEDREQILLNEIKIINLVSSLDCDSVTFLLEMNKFQVAEDYLWNRADQLDGDDYSELSSWAYFFEQDKRFLISTKIFRVLIDSILKRAYAKAYHHGIDYLIMLETMEAKISMWHPIEEHLEYFNKIKKDHGRKSSFWAQYSEVRKG